MMVQKVLIVFAHEEKESLNATLKKRTVEVLEEMGHEVKVSDLYAQNFDPVIRRKDFTDLTDDTKHINYSREAAKCYKEKTLAPYIMEEIEKISWADLLFFQFPLYWYSLPAILKGWIDKVLIQGFAYDFNCGAVLENGLLKGKRAMLSITTGAQRTMCSPKGIAGDLNVNLWPIQYTLGICGVEMLKPYIVHGALYINENTIKDVEENLKERLTGIFEEEPMKFLSIKSYAFPKGELTDEFLAQVQDKAPTVGQHMGKPIINM